MSSTVVNMERKFAAHVWQRILEEVGCLQLREP